MDIKLNLRPGIWRSIFFLILIACYSCSNNTAKKIGSAEIDSLLKKADKQSDTTFVNFINGKIAGKTITGAELWKKYIYITLRFYSQREFNKARDYSDSALALTESVKEKTNEDQLRYVQSLHHKADVLVALGESNAAIELYDLARDESIGVKGLENTVSDFNSKIGDFYYTHENYRDAMVHYRRALSSKPVGADPFLQFAFHQAQLNNIGLCYSRLKKVDSAVIQFDLAINYIKTHESLYKHKADFCAMAKGLIYGNKADVLLIDKKFNEAEVLLKKDITINSLPNRSLESAENARERLADIYLAQGRVNEVVILMDSIKKWANLKQNPRHLQSFLRLTAGIEELHGNFKYAFLANKRLLFLKDSIDDLRNKEVKADLKRIFVYNELQQQLQLFQEEKDRSKMILTSIIMVLTLITVICILAFHGYRAAKENIIELTRLNDKINIQNHNLSDTLDALKLSNNANSKITQIMAHDLRNPLVAMKNFISLLNKYTLAEPKRQQLIQMLESSASDALNLIEDTLNFNNTTSGGLNLEMIDLEMLLTHCTEQLQDIAAEKSQKIKLKAASVNILADKEKLKRVFSNLIRNAIKFSPNYSLINLALENTNHGVIISIRDTGIGIPDSIKDDIFSISDKVKRRGTQNEPSHGLGLYICKAFIDAHNGQIWFENNKTKGTTFFVSLKAQLV